MNKVQIEYEEFEKRLKETLNAILFNVGNPVRTGWSFDCGAKTMFYEACSLMLRMENEQLARERHNEEVKHERLAD